MSDLTESERQDASIACHECGHPLWGLRGIARSYEAGEPVYDEFKCPMCGSINEIMADGNSMTISEVPRDMVDQFKSAFRGNR